jgi:glycosyl transferase family 87
MSRLLDLVALRADFLRKLFWGIGILFAAYYWLYLTQNPSAPVDVRWYWSADPSNLYPNPELLQGNGYNYSPAFELVVGWGRHLDFETFTAIWRAILLVVFVWLAGPLAVFAMFTPAVASEINAGNIQILLAAAIVLGFRPGWWPATWAFVLLTKVTPGVGLLWFAFRRQWRPLAIALGVTAAIAAVTFAIWPERWFAWIELLRQGSPPPVPPYNLPLLPRLVAAVAIIAIGAWRGWRWPVVVGATLALPAFYTLSPSMLVGVLPFAREAASRWAAQRREVAAGRAS